MPKSSASSVGKRIELVFDVLGFESQLDVNMFPPFSYLYYMQVAEFSEGNTKLKLKLV